MMKVEDVVVDCSGCMLDSPGLYDSRHMACTIETGYIIELFYKERVMARLGYPRL